MPNQLIKIRIAKDSFKFASAHMTVFPDGTKESLHGHNFQVSVEIELGGSDSASFSQMVPFSVYKAALKDLCDAWDEKVLLASRCPHFKLKSKTSKEIEFELCQKRYVLPADEVVLLALDNITTESLAEDMCQAFVARLDPRLLSTRIVGVRLAIDESSGQGSSYLWKT